MISLPPILALALSIAAHLAPAAQVEVIRVPSAAMKREIPTTVVLPDASAAQPARRFPVLSDLKQRLGSIQAHPGRWDELTVINQVDRLKDGELAISIDCGTEDFFLTVNRQLHAKLTARGILHNFAEHPGTHNWDYWKLALPRQMAFLSRHLEGASNDKPAPGDADFPQPSPSARHTEKPNTPAVSASMSNRAVQPRASTPCRCKPRRNARRWAPHSATSESDATLLRVAIQFPVSRAVRWSVKFE